jgi:hypothetical protein
MAPRTVTSVWMEEGRESDMGAERLREAMKV